MRARVVAAALGTLAVLAPAARAALPEPAPRPVAAVRVQPRFATKAKHVQLFGGLEYLSRGDFFNSPGVRAGATYYPIEALGLELTVSHFWSSLNAEAVRIRNTLGAIPDSHAPGWLTMAGLRYSIGYGKLMLGGLGSAIHFEPQAFAHAGMHVHDGDIGPSADAGLGMLVFLTPRMFARFDVAVVFERETRAFGPVSVWGTLPTLGFGGTL
jgi:outer membrane beta-barrel protein